MGVGRIIADRSSITTRSRLDVSPDCHGTEDDAGTLGNVRDKEDPNRMADSWIVGLDGESGLASIQDPGVRGEWYGVMDYKKGLFAAHLLNKKACVLVRMVEAAFPSLEALSHILSGKPPEPRPPRRRLIYAVLSPRIKNVAQFGRPIDELCRGVPTYFAQKVAGASGEMDSKPCFEARILCNLVLSFCGEITGL
ncbi:gastrokine-1 [Tachyglossus aculeatus]|uniref:gastrokine-1 n=1 Tax=Tachyglossus aculeatus TaxID=9261 RepID=UPI0018F32426|nr:gastrokine-1 [Tachyglossus aculeatus]